jgi:hypothetical protein
VTPSRYEEMPHGSFLLLCSGGARQFRRARREVHGLLYSAPSMEQHLNLLLPLYIELLKICYKEIADLRFDIS